MIHLQQKGTPLGEIAYGLCLTTARNFMATVIRGQPVVAPLAFAGGGALSTSPARAFSAWEYKPFPTKWEVSRAG